MSEATTMEEIKNDLTFLKNKIIQIEHTVNEIDDNIHTKPNSEYVKKLDSIEKHDKRIKFEDIDEFDKHFD